MNTKANVIIKSEEYNEKLYFYRHSDGYPEGTMPALELFLEWVKDGKIRDNVVQSAGWLIVLGAIEYDAIPKYIIDEDNRHYDNIIGPKNWKVGAFEPTNGIHGDIEYLYVIDLDKKTIEVIESDFDNY